MVALTQQPWEPIVVCVRGPSRSGKTAFCERILRAFEGSATHIAYIKRTHHSLDLPEKSSGRIWAAVPDAMVIRTPERLQLSLPPGPADAASLVRLLPPEIDLVLLETHSPEAYPTVLSALLDPEPGELPLARWALESVDADAGEFARTLRAAVPRDLPLERALRAAIRFHGGHACPGIILGTRLALHAAASLGVPLPDDEHRLTVAVETSRCTVDALQSVIGCRVGNRSMRVIDVGKLAASFVDRTTGSSLRVAARSGLRARAETVALAGESPEDAQCRVYRELAPEELFTSGPVDVALARTSRAERVTCVACGEEVSDGQGLLSDAGPLCVPCFRRSQAPASAGSGPAGPPA